MKISTADLRSAVLSVLAHLDATERTEVVINDDYYWDVPQTARYNPYTQPEELTVGQLSEDWNEIQQMLDGKRDPMGYTAVRLAAILRRIGELTVV